MPWLQIGLLITGALIFIVTEWRLVLLALLGQYLIAGWLLAQVGLPVAAGSQILSGAVACAMLYLTARAGSGASLKVSRSFADWTVRGVTIALIAVGVFGVIQPGQWIVVPQATLMAALWLVTIGLLMLAISRQPLRIGVGLLTFETGFALVYAQLESGLATVGLLGGIQLMLALVVSFLILNWSPARL